MKAVIFCGGKGTRIRDVSEALPKPMLPIGNFPILWHIMKIYASNGVKEFILCLGYKGWIIKDFFLNYYSKISDITVSFSKTQKIKFHNHSNESDWVVTLVDTGENTETGSRLWKVRKYLENEERFCLTYGDSVADIDIRQLLKEHAVSKKIGMITGVHPLGRFGEIKFNTGVVTAFAEKPHVDSGCINGGFMVFDNNKIWNYLRPGDDLIFEREPLEQMTKDKELGLYLHKGFWQCMDTMREYDLLNKIWADNKAPWKAW